MTRYLLTGRPWFRGGLNSQKPMVNLCVARLVPNILEQKNKARQRVINNYCFLEHVRPDVQDFKSQS